MARAKKSVKNQLVELTELTKSRPARPRELARVRRIARQLADFMGLARVQVAIKAANVLGAHSKLVQDALIEKAEKLGFVSEKRGLFAEYATGGIRPDYHLKVGRSGILMEVERGKTLANNMDLLDIWKCHICREADYLFLIVPKRRPHGSGISSVIAERVVKRVATFFDKQNHVNVEGVFIFAY